MKSINQIILYGIITEKQKQIQFYDKKCLMFIVSYEKEYKGFDGEKHIAMYDFPVLAAGKMAEVVSEKRLGAELRLVGTLEQLPDGRIAIKADHIDFKPELTQNIEEE